MILPQPLSWINGETRLTAMLHLPSAEAKSALLMVPGGTDYRIGSHRSYVRLAMAFAAAGHAVMRLDVSGMGDSNGVHAGFENLGADIASAIAVLRQHLAQNTKIILWGQCDAASASLIGLGHNYQADGAILCNPWVRNAETTAEQLVRHHYRRRLTSYQSWRRLLSGQTNVWRSIKNIFAALAVLNTSVSNPSGYFDRMITNLKSGRWPCLVVIGSDDAAGQEFRLFMKKHQIAGPAICLTLIEGGNHSFSDAKQRQALQSTALVWLKTKLKTS
jgi:uncharacterized protein